MGVLWIFRHSIMLKVTWRRFDQSAKQLVVGRTTIAAVCLSVTWQVRVLRAANETLVAVCNDTTDAIRDAVPAMTSLFADVTDADVTVDVIERCVRSMRWVVYLGLYIYILLSRQLQGADLTWAQKLTWVSLIYRMEPTTKKWENKKKLKSKNR